MIGNMRMKKRMEMYGKDFGDRSNVSQENNAEPLSRSSVNESMSNILKFDDGEEDLLKKELKFD